MMAPVLAARPGELICLCGLWAVAAAIAISDACRRGGLVSGIAAVLEEWSGVIPR